MIQWDGAKSRSRLTVCFACIQQGCTRRAQTATQLGNPKIQGQGEVSHQRAQIQNVAGPELSPSNAAEER